MNGLAILGTVPSPEPETGQDGHRVRDTGLKAAAAEHSGYRWGVTQKQPLSAINRPLL